MKIDYINIATNDDERLSLPDGTKLGDLLQHKQVSEANNTISVNSAIVSPQVVLKDGDRVTITPSKVKGE